MSSVGIKIHRYQKMLQYKNFSYETKSLRLIGLDPTLFLTPPMPAFIGTSYVEMT